MKGGFYWKQCGKETMCVLGCQLLSVILNILWATFFTDGCAYQVPYLLIFVAIFC